MLKFIAGKIAGLIRRVKVNRVTFKSIGDQEFVCKTRHPLSQLLIIPGNIVLRWRKVPVQVLSTGEWIKWERKLAPIQIDNDRFSPRTLTLARIPGTPLIDILASSDFSVDQKLEFILISVKSLQHFHNRDCEVTEHGSVKLSHGDATVRNVMIDLKLKTATWFDFDLRHDLKVEANARHADDLRALLFSAAHYFPDESLTTLVHLIREIYDQSEVWQKLAQQVSSRWFNLDLFHLAHTRPVNQADIKLVASGSPLDRTQAILKAVRDSN